MQSEANDQASLQNGISIKSNIDSLFTGMTAVSSMSKRPSEMNDQELQQQTLSFRDRLKLQSGSARKYIETLTHYEQKERQNEERILHGKRKPAVTLPYAESSDYQRRKENMNKALTDEE